jgi:hypothetical protein
MWMFPGSNLLCSLYRFRFRQCSGSGNVTGKVCFTQHVDCACCKLAQIVDFFMELNCLYVNCYVLCIFLANYEYIFAQFDAQNLQNVHVLCLYRFCSFFSSWLASLVELDRSRGQLGPSPFLGSFAKRASPSRAHLQRAKCWLATSLARAGSCPALATDH